MRESIHGGSFPPCGAGGAISQGWHSRSNSNTVNMAIHATGSAAGDITLLGGMTHLDTLVS